LLIVNVVHIIKITPVYHTRLVVMLSSTQY